MEITPKDDAPFITKVNLFELPDRKFQNMLQHLKHQEDQLDYVSLADTEPVTFSVTAKDQETEALTFNFSQLGTDITTTSEVTNLVLSSHSDFTDSKQIQTHQILSYLLLAQPMETLALKHSP